MIERTNSQGKKMKFRVIDNATRLHAKVCSRPEYKPTRLILRKNGDYSWVGSRYLLMISFVCGGRERVVFLMGRRRREGGGVLDIHAWP